MMDLKEIIKWFIPCFHILLMILNKKDTRLTFICLFLLLNFCVGCAANVKSENTKNVDSYNYDNKIRNLSNVFGPEVQRRSFPVFADESVGRTFGRPFKKMMAALLPLVFQIGAASTWAVVAALVGVKTLAVTLLILKILLIAGAAKALALAASHKGAPYDKSTNFSYRPYPLILTDGTKSNQVIRPINNATNTRSQWAQLHQVGALFGSKSHGHQGWEPPHHPQKEIHLHIHNGHHDGAHDEHVPVYGSWSREDATNVVKPQPSATGFEPYTMVGPQTIKTPFGNYVKVDSNDPTSGLG